MVDENLTKIQSHLAKCLIDCIEDQNLRHIEILLSEKHANPNTILLDEGGSPLHLVIAYGQDESFVCDVIELFLKYGGDPNLRCGDLRLTPVHVAASSGKSSILYLLLKNNGDLFLRDSCGNSALEYAKESENCEWITEIAMLMNSLKDGISIHDYLQSFSSTIHQDKNASIEPIENLEPEDNNTVLSKDRYDENSSHCKSLNLFKYVYKKRKKSTECYLSPILDLNNSIKKTSMENDSKLQNKHFIDIILTSDNNSLITLDESFHEIDLKECNSKDEQHKTTSCINDNNIQNLNETVPEIKCMNNLVDNDNYSYVLTEDLSDNINESFEKKSTRSKNILSPILFCTKHSPSNKEMDGNLLHTLVNYQNKYKTPMNYIYYNSKISNCNAVDNSFESFLLNRNSNLKSDESDNTLYDDESFINSKTFDYSKTILAISEEHKYSDTEQGVHFIERRYLTKPLVLPADESGINPLLSDDTNEMSFELDTDYDTDTLRYNLTELGFNPGPITNTTKRVYLRKLVELWKLPKLQIHDDQAQQQSQKVYSAELQKTFQNHEWTSNLNQYQILEKKITDYFESNTLKKWRGGNTKSSFTYLLLDPRITLNLPLRASTLRPSELWKIFIDSIFYVGKGKRARPYAHLYEAITIWNQQKISKSNSKKIQHICDIWRDQYGVVCLHIFQNILPVEAHTREAAMIQVIGLNNLKNMKSGEYYGIAMNWRRKEKCLFGVYLLYKAMQIFLNEGERQLRPADID